MSSTGTVWWWKEYSIHARPYFEEKNPKNAKPRPDTALLMVNLQAGDEAAQVLYGKNVRRLSYRKDNPSWEAKPWEKSLIKYMRHVIVKFDSRYADHEVVAAISYAQFSVQLDSDFESAGVTKIAEHIRERRESETYPP